MFRCHHSGTFSTHTYIHKLIFMSNAVPDASLPGVGLKLAAFWIEIPLSHLAGQAEVLFSKTSHSTTFITVLASRRQLVNPQISFSRSWFSSFGLEPYSRTPNTTRAEVCLALKLHVVCFSRKEGAFFAIIQQIALHGQMKALSWANYTYTDMGKTGSAQKASTGIKPDNYF